MRYNISVICSWIQIRLLFFVSLQSFIICISEYLLFLKCMVNFGVTWSYILNSWSLIVLLPSLFYKLTRLFINLIYDQSLVLYGREYWYYGHFLVLKVAYSYYNYFFFEDEQLLEDSKIINDYDKKFPKKIMSCKASWSKIFHY